MAGEPDDGRDVGVANTMASDAGSAETLAPSSAAGIASDETVASASSKPRSIASDETVASGDSPVAGAPDRELPDVGNERYLLGKEVGRGGLGRVLHARDEVLDRPVAVKELLTSDPSSHRRFVREALITARLQHPSIIPVYDAGRRNGRSPFYAMKLVGGRPLDRAIAQAKTLPERLALLPTLLAVADAVAYAHSQHIIHRDLKPANVLVGEFGETIVIDWGLAKDLSIDDSEARDAGPFRSDASVAHTIEGAVLGTPGYMAPEQAAGEEVDERADVYAIGAILYHVVSGKMPHEGATLDEMIKKVIAGEVKPLAQRVKEVPSDLAAIVDKAMATNPAARYPSARELADDLRRYQTGQLVGAREYNIGHRIVRWIARHRAISAVTAAATIVLAVFALWSISRISKERDEAIVNANRAIINQARALLDKDPPASLAWLRQLSLDGPGWDAARTIAAAALAQPRLDLMYYGALSVKPTPDGRYAVGLSATGVWIAELATGTQPTVLPYSWWETPPLEVCDDSRTALARTSDSDTSDVLHIDLVARKVTQEKYAPKAWERALRRCQRATRLSIKGSRERRPGVRMIDPATDDDALIYEQSMAGGWLAVDGTHLVTLDGNGALYRFDLRTNQHVVLEGAVNMEPPAGMEEKDMNPDAALSNDGAVMLVVTWHRVRYCDLAKRFCADVPGEADRNFKSLAVAPDGSWVMGRTRDRAWRMPRDTPWPDAASVPRGNLSVSRDGAWVFGVYEGKVTLADVAAGTLRTLSSHSPISSAHFLADNRLLTLGSDGNVRVWSLGKPAVPHGLINFRAAYFSPSTRWMAINDGDRVLRRSRDGAVLEHLAFGLGERAHFAIGDGGDIAKLGRSGELHLWKRGTRAWSSLGLHEGGFDLEMHVLADGTLLTFSGASLAIWNGDNPRYIAIPDGITSPERSEMFVDDNGRRAVVTCGAEPFCVVDLRSGKVDRLPGSIGRGVMSRDGRIAITGGPGQTHIVWDLAGPRERRRLPAVDVEHGVLGISRDGRHAVIASQTGADLVDTERGTHMALRGRAKPNWALFSPSGRAVLDDTPMLWDVASGEGRTVLEGFDVGGVDMIDGAVIAVSRQGYITVPDDLPREPAALAAKLRAQPYRLDAKDQLIIAP